MKKVLSLLLACASALPLLASCGGSGETTAQTSSNPATETAVETEPAYTPAVKNFGGKTYTILAPSEREYDFAEELTGEIVNDAFYERDSKIAEQYGVKFNVLQEKGGWSDRATYNGLISGAALAGDSVYDAIYAIIACTTETFTKGYYLNFLDYTDYMNLNEVWWCPDQTETFSIAGKLFGAVGSFTLDPYKEVGVMYVNMKLVEDMNLTSPYQAVLDGKWTFDLFAEMATTATVDINGDGKIVFGEDTIGFISRETNNRTLQTGFDITVITKDKDGKFTVTAQNERTAEIIDHTKTFFTSNSVYVNGGITSSVGDTELQNAFMADKSLFLYERMKISENMRDMESDYGVLPAPKYNEEQEYYYTQMATGTMIMTLPLCCADPEMTAMVSEALSFYGRENVVPKYYESALKAKYMRDATSSQIIDVIFAHTSQNIANAYATNLGGNPWITKILQECAFKNAEYASTVASQTAVWQGKLDEIVTAFETLE